MKKVVLIILLIFIIVSPLVPYNTSLFGRDEDKYVKIKLDISDIYDLKVREGEEKLKEFCDSNNKSCKLNKLIQSYSLEILSKHNTI
ncbi:MAG: hypothetical protein E7214_00660 [Clostridium sp.]|nr:hypothetical protein [Clostridium sp.]